MCRRLLCRRLRHQLRRNKLARQSNPRQSYLHRQRFGWVAGFPPLRLEALLPSTDLLKAPDAIDGLQISPVIPVAPRHFKVDGSLDGFKRLRTLRGGVWLAWLTWLT
jgi:hypothetical protein